MSIIHHPSDATLSAFASGTLDEARGIVVAAHLSLCAQCRNAVHAFEEAGGALLDDVAPEACPPALAARHGPLGPSSMISPRSAARCRAPGDLPAPLSRYAVGPWRWIGRGVQCRPVSWRGRGCPGLYAKSRRRNEMPRHRHTGTEWTCVFEGAFTHDLGRYGSGDFDEADESVEHNPVVDAAAAAFAGGAARPHRAARLAGALIQPFVRI